MDKTPESANSESIIFDMDLDIQEDVDACLAEFVFLVRLDLHEDARHMAEDILWRHIGSFPVFAELAVFFIMIQDVRAASDLIVDLAARRIVFAGTDEQEFLQMVALFARDRLSASTLAALSQKGKLMLEGPGSGKANEISALCSPFLEIDYDSIAQLQNVEIRLYTILVAEQHEKPSDVVEFAIDHIQTLIEFRLLREATEIFLYLCIHFHNTGQTYDILNLYNNLSELLEQHWKTSAANDEIKDVLLTKTTAKTALFIALRGKLQSAPLVGQLRDIDELVQDIKKLNNILFSMITDTKPPQSLIDHLHECWHVRKHPPLLDEDVSNAAHTELAQDQEPKSSDDVQINNSSGFFILQPARPVYVIKSKEQTYVQSPQEEVYVQNPRGTVYVQEPQETVYVQWPKQMTYVQKPQDTVYVQAPEQVTYVQSPEGTVYVQVPEQVTYVQGPRETVYVQAPEQITYVQQPQEAVYVQESKGPVNVHAAENETNVAGSRGPVRIYQPEGDVYIYASKAQVHLYDPAAKIHIHKPNDGIHVYELGDDAHADAVHHLLHTHTNPEGEIAHAEQEPLPPYAADYEIPETIILNQLQKLHEMGVIKSIVEKLPDPPEYTASTISP